MVLWVIDIFDVHPWLFAVSCDASSSDGLGRARAVAERRNTCARMHVHTQDNERLPWRILPSVLTGSYRFGYFGYFVILVVFDGCLQVGERDETVQSLTIQLQEAQRAARAVAAARPDAVPQKAVEQTKYTSASYVMATSEST